MPSDAVVVSLGGSFLVKDDGVDVAFAQEVGRLLERVAGKDRTVYVVVGGGAVARTYIQAARKLGADEGSLDEIGITVTRANARVLIAALPGAYPRPAESFDEALLAARAHYPVVVMGGTHAGHTTDAVSAMMAERARARLVIATNVDGVYDSDPKKNPAAKRLAKLTADDLVRITFTGKGEAGSAGVVDPLGARIIARASLRTYVVHGRDLKALEGALLGAADVNGSVIG